MNSQIYPIPESGRMWAQTFTALRYRNFRLPAQLISVMGTWMQSTPQGWLVYQRIRSKLLIGIVATGVVQPWHGIAVAGLIGATTAFDMPVRQAFFLELSAQPDWGNGARMLGPMEDGFFMADERVAWSFLNGLSFVPVRLVWACMELLPCIPPVQMPLGEYGWDVLLYVGQNQPVWLMLGLRDIGDSYAVSMPALARTVIGAIEHGYSALLAATGIGAFVGFLWLASTGKRQVNRLGSLAGLAVLGGMWLALVLTCCWEWTLVWLTRDGA